MDSERSLQLSVLKADPGYTEIICTAPLHGLEVFVGRGNLLHSDGPKVLPTNEFFNLGDSDCNNSNPKSIIGQYLQPLTDRDRRLLQNTIDGALGRDAITKTSLGYGFGHTVIAKWKSDCLIVTNTVKYDVEKLNRRVKQTGVDGPKAGCHSQHLSEAMPQEPPNHPEQEAYSETQPNRRAPRRLIDGTREQLEDQYYKSRVHYDTCLMAIGQCIENIVRVALQHGLDRIAIPLLGAGWGGLSQKAVFTTLLCYLSKSLITTLPVHDVLSGSQSQVSLKVIRFFFRPQLKLIVHSCYSRYKSVRFSRVFRNRRCCELLKSSDCTKTTLMPWRIA